MATLIKKAKKQRKGKKFGGHPPKKSKYPECEIVDSYNDDGVAYDLWFLRTTSNEYSNDWHHFKLVTLQRGPKGNYWMSWDGERIRGADIGKLEEHVPKVYTQVERFIKRYAREHK